MVVLLEMFCVQKQKVFNDVILLGKWFQQYFKIMVRKTGYK